MNWRSKVACLLLLSFVFTLISPSLLLAEDIAKGFSEGASEHTAGLIELVNKAFNGDTDARNDLINEKAIPALVMLAALVFSWTIASSVGRYVGGMVSRKVDLTLGKFLTKAVRNMLMMVVAFGVLTYHEVDVTGLAAILAALGFAVGMALQGTLGNFASGIMLLLFRPFKVEDLSLIHI